jgi:hypothetical protein
LLDSRACSGGGLRKRSAWWKELFFFEKKNQKTFARAGARRSDCVGSMGKRGRKSFLLLFFKKEALSSTADKPPNTYPPSPAELAA